jgi:hypothetical protein
VTTIWQLQNPPLFAPNPDATEIRISARMEDGKFLFTGLPNKRGYLGKIAAAPLRAEKQE